MNTKLIKKNNSSGFITGEFIFAMVLAAGVSSVLFAITFTLSVIEISQYISFASTRSMISGNMTPEDQEQAAKDKYKNIINKKPLRGLFFGDGAMFALSTDIDVRIGGSSGKDFREAYASAGADLTRTFYTGTRIELTPKIMNMKIAFLGSTSESGEATAFTTKLDSLLIREPSWQECNELYVNQRYQAIGNMNDRFKEYGNKGSSQYVPLEDNGC